MVDRFKYFLLGILFLVVAGVIAYDRWNSVDDAIGPEDAAQQDQARVDVSTKPPVAEPPVQPPVVPPGTGLDIRPPATPPKPAVVEPKPVPKPVVVEPPEPKPAGRRIHTVQSGETLEVIALHYYGRREGIAWIADANGLQDKNRIFVRQKLIIPARKEMRSGVAAPAPKPTKIPSRYVVKQSDGNLYVICRRFYGSKGEGARVARIMKLNGLYSATVKAGTVLNLPPK